MTVYKAIDEIITYTRSFQTEIKFLKKLILTDVSNENVRMLLNNEFVIAT
jgi:hypothetical protein